MDARSNFLTAVRRCLTLSYMYSSVTDLASDRRADGRIRTEMFLNQYVREQPYRALATNLSPTGLFLQKLVMPTTRHAPSVGLEFELPGTGEVIWAGAECRFDAVGSDFHLTGLRFTAMARKHERLIRDYVRDKEWMLERMWLRLRLAGARRNMT
jgi:hypothetical protein